MEVEGILFFHINCSFSYYKRCLLLYHGDQRLESIVWTVMSTNYYFQEILHGMSFIGLNGRYCLGLETTKKK